MVNVGGDPPKTRIAPGNSLSPFWDGENLTLCKGLSDLQPLGDQKVTN